MSAAAHPIDRWHRVVAARDAALLDDLLAEDVVFESPVLHRPQAGKALTAMYLAAATQVLNNETFRYLNEWRGERSAVLEFACEVDGLTINGVDMIFWNADGRIDRFKVMVRPMKALTHLRDRMAAMLEALGGKAS